LTWYVCVYVCRCSSHVDGLALHKPLRVSDSISPSKVTPPPHEYLIKHIVLNQRDCVVIPMILAPEIGAINRLHSQGRF